MMEETLSDENWLGQIIMVGSLVAVSSTPPKLGYVIDFGGGDTVLVRVFAKRHNYSYSGPEDLSIKQIDDVVEVHVDDLTRVARTSLPDYVLNFIPRDKEFANG